ncbi:MAG TPA: hypothetical protein VF705_03250 [Longimicrobium sp.]
MIGDRVRQAANVVFAVGQMIAVPLLAMTASADIGAVSDQYPTYVVPAGYAFGIWSLIFALSLAYAVWQALPAQTDSPLPRRVGWFTAAAFAGATLWQIVFPAGMFALSVLVIFGMLAALAVVAGRTVPRLRTLSRAEFWLVRVTFSIYLGWITVASVANAAQTLSAAGWSASSPGAAAWGVAMLLASGAIAAAVVVATVANLPYALTVIWALVGVYIGQRTGDTPLGTGATQAAAIIAAALVGAAALASSRRHRAATA